MIPTIPEKTATATDIDSLPEGWCACALPDVADLIMGQSPPGSTYNDDSDGLPFFQGKIDFRDRYPVVRKWCSSPTKIVERGDVLMSIRAPVGPTNVADQTCAIGRGLAAIRPTEATTTEFLLFALRLQEQTLAEKGTGSTFTAISRSHLDAISLPLPPLPEQTRIVAKVEALLARVNAARERLAKMPALVKRFRQSVLAAACSGQLTADWRADIQSNESSRELLNRLLARRVNQWSLFTKNRYKPPVDPDCDDLPDHPDGWAVASMDQLTVLITSGSRAWSQYYGRGTGTFIMAQNVRPGLLDLASRQSVDPPLNSPDRVRSQVKKGDLLVTIVGANTGDVCAVPKDLPEHYVCQSVSLMRPTDTALTGFLNLWLNSTVHGQGQYRRYIYGEGRPHLSFDHLRQTAVALPPIQEQQEIVRRVDALFALADKIESRVQGATARVEKITQAILAKAFHGELVPTEAELARQQGRDYEPASVLLERIRAARATAEKSPRRRKPHRKGAGSRRP